MSERTPIKASEIREGDLVRWEANDSDAAHEWRAGGPDWSGRHAGGQLFLLERPVRELIALPDEPTLGWLVTSACSVEDLVPVGTPVLDYWQSPVTEIISIRRNGRVCGVDAAWVTSFVPFESALDALALAYPEPATAGNWEFEDPAAVYAFLRVARGDR